MPCLSCRSYEVIQGINAEHGDRLSRMRLTEEIIQGLAFGGHRLDTIIPYIPDADLESITRSACQEALPCERRLISTAQQTKA